MYSYKTSIQPDDMDLAGIMFYGNFFTYMHNAYEAFMDHKGLSLLKIISEKDWLLPIVHAEADYQKSLTHSQPMTIEIELAEMGKHSFVMKYVIKNEQLEPVASAKTVHVALSKETRAKIVLPNEVQVALSLP